MADRLLSFAKQLRREQTDAERRLWRELRAGRFVGAKFKRQQPIGGYIVDFVCFEERLVIELDGGQHQVQTDYDGGRDKWLRSQGFRVLRFWNNEVMQQFDGVLERILNEISPSPQPSPIEGEGEEPPLSPRGRGAGGEGESKENEP
jgi:very-short-patch-repair endonuclease